MPYCPVCKHQFESPASECPTDKTPLVDELPFQTVESPGTTWVEIASVGSDDEARLLAGFLEAEGIPAEVESLRFSMEPVNLGQMSEIRVYVGAEDEHRAMELLAARADRFSDLPDGGEKVLTDDGASDIDDMADVEES
ncbi:MAG TPA: DUF2007 domain-containing protein [Thermoanaerobaculia bacterium]|nr:DUF2007 domain-containing protein [Thermoanaerobaculia bacterium]